MTDHSQFLLQINDLRLSFEGDLHTGDLQRTLYATDASAYREMPLGVALPRHQKDIRTLLTFAGNTGIPLIPRAAGTSLAGQVVGSGLVVDISRHMTSILEINREEHWVRLQPGVILDELNKTLEPYGLFFGPETSTSSRCMIGGMVGNNSCGAHSILYGSTRDHVISVKGFLSDGSEVEFKALSLAEFKAKCEGSTLENKIYRQIGEILSDPENQASIRNEFPAPALHRRNTGYALDLLLASEPFTPFHPPTSPEAHQHNSTTAHQHIIPSAHQFNFCNLIAGSEGTLMFITEITLNLVPLPPKEKALLCVHCHSVAESLKANLIALKYAPGSVELMDKAIMDCTRDNITQRKNRFFIEGDPGAILIVEFARESKEEITKLCRDLVSELQAAGMGYHFPVVFPPDLKKVWDLRKAGLGVLSNYPGDRKPVPVIEDTAVDPAVLPDYIEEFDAMLFRLGLDCVYYAHVGSGELHLRPVLNLKDPADVELFHTVALETAKLVKKYRGSLSGEHGDGRLRGEFIPLMLGDRNYRLFKEIKATWDPGNILNPGKITDTPKMNTSLRFTPGKPVRDIPTVFDFSRSHGILRAVEQCNGSGDCRNTVITGHWMCPSYMAVKDESTTTRARANTLREFLTRSEKVNPFDHKEIYDVMDLCISCKACKSECPSNVDMARLKAEFLQHWYDAHGVPLRSRLIAGITTISRLGSIAPSVYNFFQKNRLTSSLVKNLLGFAPQRNFPLLSRETLRQWARRNPAACLPEKASPSGSAAPAPTVYLFTDEFTNHNEADIGIKAIRLLTAFGYSVILPDHDESGRTYLSKGLVRTARKLAEKNVRMLRDIVTPEKPLIGIEPSAILSFRDEYPDLVDESLKEDAHRLSASSFLIDEFIANPPRPHPITPAFSDLAKSIRLHGHCHQKALASVEPTIIMLSLPQNYKVEEIKSGCCGMAGSFGYENEHYEVSLKVGELVLFPAVREATAETLICAPGTSCRHQIADGTGRKALHPVEILFGALEP